MTCQLDKIVLVNVWDSYASHLDAFTTWGTQLLPFDLDCFSEHSCY